MLPTRRLLILLLPPPAPRRRQRPARPAAAGRLPVLAALAPVGLEARLLAQPRHLAIERRDDPASRAARTTSSRWTSTTPRPVHCAWSSVTRRRPSARPAPSSSPAVRRPTARPPSATRSTPCAA